MSGSADDNPDLNVVWPIRKTPGLNRAYQFGILREDGPLARYTAVCSPLSTAAIVCRLSCTATCSWPSRRGTR